MKKSVMSIRKEKKSKKTRIVEFKQVSIKSNSDLKKAKSLPSIFYSSNRERNDSNANKSSSIQRQSNASRNSSLMFRQGKSIFSLASLTTSSGQQQQQQHQKPRAWSSSPQYKMFEKRKLPSIANFVPVLPKSVVTHLTSVMTRASFVGFNRANVHEHNHVNRTEPHMHRAECERYASGFDRNRECRFYFTKSKTPVRVYLKYNEKLALATGHEYRDDTNNLNVSQLNPTLNGRKLSARTLKGQLKISSKFVDEAKNFVFIRENLSLVPIPVALPPNAPPNAAVNAALNLNANSTNLTGRQSMTLAEMALMGPPQSTQNPTQTATKHKEKSSSKKVKSSSILSGSNADKSSLASSSFNKLSQFSFDDLSEIE